MKTISVHGLTKEFRLGERTGNYRTMREWFSRGPREPVAFAWSVGILLFWLWLVAMLFQSTGRAAVVAMIVITTIGFSIRRSCGLKWVLVTLTFEGALRIGMARFIRHPFWLSCSSA